MYNCKIPKNNSLKKEIEKILKMCEKNDEESGAEDSYFEEGIEEQKMTDWENANGVTIPESYKDWLRFSRKCRIVRNTATFWGPDEFHSNYVPDDLVVIGEMIGDGEVVCFSKKTGKFVRYFERREKFVTNNFSSILEQTISMNQGDSIFTPERKAEILAKLKQMRENGEL